MLAKATIITFAILFALSLVAAVFVYSSIIALGIILFLLLITSTVVIQDTWKASEETKQRIHEAELESRYRTGKFAGIALSLKLATKCNPSSRRDIAVILREALLNKYAESKDYPAPWIYTESGRDAILQILGPMNGDLIDVLEPSDKPPSRKLLGARRDDLYFSKLNRVLHLVETKTEE
jgi:hypothetical protein